MQRFVTRYVYRRQVRAPIMLIIILARKYEEKLIIYGNNSSNVHLEYCVFRECRVRVSRLAGAEVAS